MSRPILAVDVDGVISPLRLRRAAGRATIARFELVDGMVHCISLPAGERLLRLGEHSSWSGRPAGRTKPTSTCPAARPARASAPHLRRRRPLRLGPLEAGRRSTSTARAGRWPGSTTTSTRAATSGRESATEPTLLVPTESAPRPRGGPGRSLDRLGARPRTTDCAVAGFWPIFFLLVVLKIPVLGALWLVWWASQRRPSPRTSRRGLRRRLQALAAAPHAPRGPHRGPHGGGARRRMPLRRNLLPPGGPQAGRGSTPSRSSAG